MWHQRIAVAGCGLLLLAALAVALVRDPAPTPVRAAPGEERGFDAKAALKVVMKNQAFEYIDSPKVDRIGGRAFVVGHRLNSSTWVWLPVDDISQIEEYANLDDMIRVYPGLAPKK